MLPSDEELAAVADVNLDLLNLKVELVDGIPDIESIVLDELHFNRGDTNDNMIVLRKVE